MSGANYAGHGGGRYVYEIRVDGHLEPGWAEWLAELRIENRPDGQTVLSGPLSDQAALHGVLNKIRDLGLTLIEVKLVETEKG